MRIKILHLFYLLFLTFIVLSCQKKDDTKEIEITNPDKLNNVLDQFVKEGLYPFLYARLEDLDGNVIYEHSSINDKLLPDTKINGNTWIRIWSMSKIVTISVVMDLIEDGVLKINDSVSKYIPEFENLQVAVSNSDKSLIEYDWGQRENACPIKLISNDSTMTIRQLLTHEAGFYYATTGFACLDSMIALQNLPKAKNSEDLIRKIKK